MSDDSMVTVVSKDKVEIKVSLRAIQQSITIGTMLSVLDATKTAGQSIPVPAVTGRILTKVVEWCEHHREDPVATVDATGHSSHDDLKVTEMPAWDAEFFNIIDKNMVLHIINAANYLEIPLLQQYGCKTMASRIKGKTTEEMRALLNIENDLTPEEEEKIRKENAFQA
ncbi:E3 ubiquitin ligase SCF complex, Skp subunit [Nemania sp. FL0916]|nr:E3 ubiquitin ligase SCF complex, Skp subunit [Nemania sp. FL0916]